MSGFTTSSDATYIDENELIAQASMIVEWAVNSISEELAHGVDNMRDLSWLSQGHARRGIAAKIQVGVYFWMALRRIRISPFYLRSAHDVSRDFLTRTTDSEITQRANTHVMKRAKLGARWGRFVKLTMSLHEYPNIQPSWPVHYRSLAALKENFAEFNPRSCSLCYFVKDIGLIYQWLGAFRSTIGKLSPNSGSEEYTDGPMFMMVSSITSQLALKK